MAKLCSKCNERPRHASPSRTRSYCKPCLLKWQTEHRLKNHAQVREYANKYHADRGTAKAMWEAAKADPVLYAKLKARWTINQNVSAGKLIKPQNCSKCGGFGMIEAHHTDYSRPLDVQWLCKSCHTGEHHGTESATHL